MKTINRTALLIKGREPYVKWANSFDEGDPILDINDQHSTAYLIPDTYDEFNYEKYLKKNFKIIFESELEAWMADPNVWPQQLTYKKLKEWFEIQVSDIIFDLGKGDVITEE